MKNVHNRLTCLFGHHDYSDTYIKDKDGDSIYLCKICKRSGYWKYNENDKVWCDYDDDGNCVHAKWSDGDEFWWPRNSRWS